MSIVGIGEDGAEGLSAAAAGRVAAADLVFGGVRHLALATALIRGERRPWPGSFDVGIAAVVACRGRPVCVLASGDPFHYGVGATLARHVAADEMVVVPAPSAFSLAAARLGWSLPEVVTLALHARPLAAIRPHLQPGARILTYVADGAAPAALAALLTAAGFGRSTVWVHEALGGPRERVRRTTAAAFDLAAIDALNLVAIEVDAGADAPVPALAPGRADTLFEHDGQISKGEIRAVALAALAPRRGDRLWDIGGGAGSVAIEWLLVDRSLRAIVVERHAERAARIARNAATFGVCDLTVVHGAAPAALAELPRPNAVFVGGGASAEVLGVAGAALPSGGRLVAHAVTLETEALLLRSYAEMGGALTRLEIARAVELGTRTGWRTAMPITQWSWTKP